MMYKTAVFSPNVKTVPFFTKKYVGVRDGSSARSGWDYWYVDTGHCYMRRVHDFDLDGEPPRVKKP